MPITKTWIVTSGNSRHPYMDGDTVAVFEPFSNGGQYPGDPILGVEEVANCKCDMVLQGEAGKGTQLSPEEREAMTAYQDDYAGTINRALREGRQTNVTKLMDEAMIRQPPLEESTRLYRAVGTDVAERMQPGTVFRDQGYASTTTKREVAEEYAAEMADLWGTPGTVVEIEAPAGSQVFNYQTHPEFLDEAQAEVLLLRQSEFRVHSSGVLRLETEF